MYGIINIQFLYTWHIYIYIHDYMTSQLLHIRRLTKPCAYLQEAVAPCHVSTVQLAADCFDPQQNRLNCTKWPRAKPDIG